MSHTDVNGCQDLMMEAVTFAGLSLLQQLHDGSLSLLQTILEGLIADGLLPRAEVIDQSLQVMKLLPLLVHLERQTTQLSYLIIILYITYYR